MNFKKCNSDMEELEFNLGDTVYSIDDDYNYFEDELRRIEINHDRTITYSTGDYDFLKEDIGEWIFKSEMEREFKLESIFLDSFRLIENKNYYEIEEG